MKKTLLRTKIEIARGTKPAEKVFKNCKIIDLFTSSIYEGDIAVYKGEIIAIGSYECDQNIDLKGKYISPTLIDAHVHIESSLVTPAQFSKVLISHGVTTIIADPHEIANVAGTKGIDYILLASEELPIKTYIMVPSCVPCTNFENSGARLKFKDLEKYIGNARVLGLGEMMNYPGVINSEIEVIDKLEGFREKIKDGHAPSVNGKELAAYVAGEIMTDHECSTVEEMLEKMRLGMYILIREGTVARNAKTLFKCVNKENISRCLLCTDDKHPSDLIGEGSVDYNVRLAIESGIDPIDAIKMGSLNTAIAYNLEGVGAIAPNYKADFIVLNSLEKFEIDEVYIKGEKVYSDNKIQVNIDDKYKDMVTNSVKIGKITSDDLAIRIDDKFANVIVAIPDSLITEKLCIKPKNKNGLFVADSELAKLAIVERHTDKKSIGLGIIKGLGIKNGAIASTVAHDSHNCIVAGDNDEDMIKAVERIKELQGGYVVVQKQKVISELRLPIAGLMSDMDLEEVNLKLRELMDAAHRCLGVYENIDPIITLGFMGLPVIPKIKLTDRGLFDVEKFEFIDITYEGSE